MESSEEPRTGGKPIKATIKVMKNRRSTKDRFGRTTKCLLIFVLSFLPVQQIQAAAACHCERHSQALNNGHKDHNSDSTESMCHHHIAGGGSKQHSALHETDYNALPTGESEDSSIPSGGICCHVLPQIAGSAPSLFVIDPNLVAAPLVLSELSTATVLLQFSPKIVKPPRGRPVYLIVSSFLI